jgi:hypothetical protein
MKRASVLSPILMLAAPMMAVAQDVPQPKYPPGFDCASVPAGAEREACEESQLNPKADKEQTDKSLTGTGSETPGTVSPPTVPDQPDNENRGTAPGTNGGAGGVGN